MVVNAAWSHAVTGPGGGIPYALGMTSAPATTTFAAAITLTSGDFSVNIIARANAGINIDLESAFFFLYGTNEVRGSTWTSTYSYQWGYNFYDGLGYKYAMYPKTSLCDVFTDGNWHQITYKFKRDEAKAIVMIDGSTLSHSVDGGTLSAYSDLDFQFDEVRFAYPPTNLNMTIAEFWLAKTLTVTQYTFPVSA